MSVPVSMRVGPYTPMVLVKKRYLIFYVFLIYISILPVFLEFWFYWNLLYQSRPIHFFVFLPLFAFVAYLTMFFTALIFSKLLLTIVNLFHNPREGVFLRDPSDKDYRYWSLRSTIKRWPVYIAHKFPFPFLDNICFKAFGVKTSIHNSLFEGWVDTEFIEFGKNVVVGQASTVQSAVIIGNLLIIKKTIIEDNVRIGAHAIVMPGAYMKKNSVLGASSIATCGQILEDGWIYVGTPATKFKENIFFRDGLANAIEHTDLGELREKFEERYQSRYAINESLKERRERIKAQKELEKKRLEEGR
ncbi:MAG: hypothetical protein ACTSR8_16090 [Promethearchaeota archaeon]